jgi:hypothetical protein
MALQFDRPLRIRCKRPIASKKRDRGIFIFSECQPSRAAYTIASPEIGVPSNNKLFHAGISLADERGR